MIYGIQCICHTDDWKNWPDHYHWPVEGGYCGWLTLQDDLIIYNDLNFIYKKCIEQDLYHIHYYFERCGYTMQIAEVKPDEKVFVDEARNRRWY